MPDLYLPIETLQTRGESYLASRLQKKTMRGYNRLVERYVQCCGHYNVQSFPISEHSICLWMAHLTGTCSGNSIANYLSAIGDFCRVNNLEYSSIRHSFRVRSSLNGIKILHPRVTIRKQPITLTHLQQLHQRVDHNDLQEATFFAMATCCFFGLLRLGEVTHHEDNRRTLLFEHVKNICSRGLTITLPASKTDPYWNSSEVFIPRLPNVYCPVKALENMLSLERVKHNHILFANSHGNAFTRAEFTRLLRLYLFDDPLVSGHSFRAGGATWAANLGLSELQICRLGRWASDCFRKYIRAHPLLEYILEIDPDNLMNQG